MQIYEALKKDHEEVKQLLNQLLSLPDNDEKQHGPLIAKIRDALIPHSRAEEAVFYNSFRLIDASKKLGMHGYSEHLAAESLLRTLQVKGKIDADWKVTARELKAALEHHIAEEESEMFTAGRALFTNEEADAMGEAFEKMKPEIKEEGLMGTTIDMLKNMMPPRFIETFVSTARNIRF
ncbi:MAG: hemerythrin domain-containing protein [Bdellovibrionaceae bacterium]|nr:hemerythrin domain-containing protein [Bdellovibrio sp.]